MRITGGLRVTGNGIKFAGPAGPWTPTIPTGTTLDTFTTTDIFKGELFLNSTDDNLWVRTENGILQILDSGFTSSNGVNNGLIVLYSEEYLFSPPSGNSFDL